MLLFILQLIVVLPVCQLIIYLILAYHYRFILSNLSNHIIVIKFSVADVPKEDLICHLPETNQFIKEAIANGGTVLVHW